MLCWIDDSLRGGLFRKSCTLHYDSLKTRRFSRVSNDEVRRHVFLIATPVPEASKALQRKVARDPRHSSARDNGEQQRGHLHTCGACIGGAEKHTPRPRLMPVCRCPPVAWSLPPRSSTRSNCNSTPAGQSFEYFRPPQFHAPFIPHPQEYRPGKPHPRHTNPSPPQKESPRAISPLTTPWASSSHTLTDS